MQESAAPEYASALLGWRGWVAVEENGSIRLYSPVYHTVWLPRRETVAFCRKEPAPSMWAPLCPPQHGAPSADCRCGIYASPWLTLAAQYADGRRSPLGAVAPVLGQVCLWGRVVECERGWRGAYAYPSRLYLPLGLGRTRFRPAGIVTAEQVAAALAAYGVRVDLIACRTVGELAETLHEAEAPAGQGRR